MARFNTIAILILALFLILPIVDAIGISPSTVDINFEPNLNTTLEFVAINNLDEPRTFEVYFSEDLAEYISYDDRFMELKPMEKKPFKAHFELPDIIKPGTHTAHVGVVETTIQKGETGETALVAKAGTESLVNIHAPYNNVFIELKLEASSANVGDSVTFKIDAKNLGKQALEPTQIKLDIFEGTEKLTTIYTEAKEIKGQASQEYTAQWTVKNPGTYKAVATIAYDNREVTTQTLFRVGHLFVKIIDVVANDILQGTVGKFETLLESEWNNKIILLQVIEISKQGETIEVITSEDIDLNSYEAKTIVSYWDTKNADTGAYNVLVKLIYEDRTTEYETTVRVVKFSKEAMSNLMTIIIALSVVVLFLSFLYVKLSKNESN